MVEITMEVEERLLIELDDRDIGPEMTVAVFFAVVERVCASKSPAEKPVSTPSMKIERTA